MTEVYRRWMHAWEERLCSRATDRVVRPFEWGLDWTRQLAQRRLSTIATAIATKPGCAC